LSVSDGILYFRREPKIPEYAKMPRKAQSLRFGYGRGREGMEAIDKKK
jgi:hypothetical protein